jgi:hypothetical protein
VVPVLYGCKSCENTCLRFLLQSVQIANL